ncbi:PREDICTED: rab-like protein 6 [Nicrophorus vespilloides]|uniref:Rab-like protein 6 n=1 Tax=Nicrophorus vespilloides TaxID=110193 RepID=A0ABM1MM65_NICVS|nr:PREDICTED: rab-like protein 6 [Nicrophorus vespilloides]
MFSAIKRFTSKGDGASSSGTGVASKPPGHQTMSSSLQRKFAKGVQYNMKIIIKGDRNVGKTCLFQRLQGKKFMEEYIPTDEIQVTSIQWSYKATDDIVKVEVWDVVDKGKKKKRFEGLKLENADMPEETALDAEFLDVYKGTNGIILVMDITKSWTFEYVQREMPKIPSHIPVIILANHCDMSHHRTVTSDHISYYIESIEGTRTAQVRYSESSMRNGFGLKLLHKFFNLPFLQLQRETLLRQLERNEKETDATIQELDLFAESDDANYTKFQENLTRRRREIADSNANIPPPAVLPVSASSMQLGSGGISNVGTEVKRSQSASIIIGAGKPIPFGNNGIMQKNSSSQSSGKTSSQSSGFVSKFGVREDGVAPDLRRLEISPITSVEEFCPDGGQLDRSFLDDVQSYANTANNEVDESDSDGEIGNPLVSEYQDDLEMEEVKPNVFRKGGGSSDIDLDMKQTNDEFDSTINSEISELTSDAFDTWMGADSKWRRSPEGGEDVSAVSQTLDYSGSTVYDDSTSVTSSNVHMELLSSKHSHSPSRSDSEQTSSVTSLKKEKKRDKEKSDKKQKSKKSKDKEKVKEAKGEKRHKRRSREENTSQHRDELEEFLNGSASPCLDAAYEAI